MRTIRSLTWACVLLCFTGLTSALATVPTTESKAKPTVASSPAKAKSKPKISSAASKAAVKSGAFLVIDEENSSVLLSKNADTAVPIASITKLMTALVVLEAQQPLDESLKITKEDRDIEIGRRSRLVVGASLPRGELLHLALMSSENRAANAVGRNYPGGLPALLKAMNTKAKALGMKSSRFVDPTGLSSGNVATPRDLSKLVMAASRNETIREYSTDPEQVVKVGKYLVEYRNTNTLTRNADWNVVVQKTGFTNAAGQCLVMKAIIDERPVVMVLMNSFGKHTRVADARRVRRWIEDSEASLLGAGAAQRTARAK